MDNNNPNIEVRQTKRGVEIHALNHKYNRWLHVGTIRSKVYEKQSDILRTHDGIYEPSFCLPPAELEAVMEAGAQFLRCIPGDKSATYSIALQDFKTHAEPFQHPVHGGQMRCSLKFFEAIAATARRNARRDNPVTVRPFANELPLWKQTSLFG